DAMCCNVADDETRTCGTDCDDVRPGTSSTATEACDGLDNDCDGSVDEGVLTTYTIDADGDGHGSDVEGAATMVACTLPEGYAEPADDCDDAVDAVHPGLPEICDDNEPPLDENCDGEANPATFCECEAGQTRDCELPGVCASGVEACDAARGVWDSCSIEPAPETCDTRDEDCDGTVDEGTTVTCYEDGDNDGYAAAGTPASQECPRSERPAVGGCPVNSTNREPVGANVDCNDGNAAVSPGSAEVCNESVVADEDCDGTIDEDVAVICYTDTDNDTWPQAGATDQSRCPVGSRGFVGGCPIGTTDAEPADGADCNDNEASINPDAEDVCTDSIDNDCNGTVNDSCMCTSPDTRNCMQAGRCADGTQDCLTNGTWSTCSIMPTSELCNNEDDDCDSKTDEAFECVLGSMPLSCTVHDADGDGTSDDGCALAPGSRSCSGSCTLSDCVGAEICNGCDDDGDGTDDDGFLCAQGETGVSCTTACGETGGTGTCNGTCDGIVDCSLTQEACNYCDDTLDGTIHDEAVVATQSTSERAKCSNTSAAIGLGCVESGETGHTGPPSPDPQRIMVRESLGCSSWCIFSNVVTYDPAIRLGYGPITVKTRVYVRNQTTAQAPEYGWAMILDQGGTAGFSSTADSLGYDRSSISKGLAFEWRFNGNSTDTLTVRRLNGTANGTVLQTRNVNIAARNFDTGDGTSVLVQNLYVRYTPELTTTGAWDERLDVRGCSFGSTSCTNMITLYSRNAGPLGDHVLNQELNAGRNLDLTMSAQVDSASRPYIWWGMSPELPLSTQPTDSLITTEGVCSP
ncbi:MAG: hypothetical protein GWO04_02075, partial [Actinobacteria bacterium]|nr:hypothetical protein [Actinomycetota bacterium]